MKMSGRLAGLAGILAITAGTVFGSDYEKGKGHEYEHRSGYEHEMYGTVEKLPDGMVGAWTINGKQVDVTNETRIEEEYGKARVGAYVEVKGKKDGKSFKAYKIEVKRSKK